MNHILPDFFMGKTINEETGEIGDLFVGHDDNPAQCMVVVRDDQGGVTFLETFSECPPPAPWYAYDDDRIESLTKTYREAVKKYLGSRKK